MGATANNMGPSVLYVTEKDPLPFEISLAIAYKDTFSIGNWPVVDIATETRAHREFVKNHEDDNPDPFYQALFTSVGDEPLSDELAQIQLHWGAEITFFESLSFRSGFLFDWVGERYEWHLGTGFRLFIHRPTSVSTRRSRLSREPSGPGPTLNRKLPPNRTASTML